MDLKEEKKNTEKNPSFVNHFYANMANFRQHLLQLEKFTFTYKTKITILETHKTKNIVASENSCKKKIHIIKYGGDMLQ